MEKRMNRRVGKEDTRSLLELFTGQMILKIALANTRTAANYNSCINKLYLYLGKCAPNFQLKEVNAAWVKGWVDWLTVLHPNHPETVDFYFRNTRAMYNLALPPQKKKQRTIADPFKDIKIKKLQPSKRALSGSDVKALLATGFRDSLKPSLRETLDILLFLFFANGMVFQDVYNLRWDMVDEKGRIRFLRSKTGSLVEVCIVPEAKEIMERYHRMDSPFIFAFLHFGKKNAAKPLSELSALRRVNLHASIIGKMAKLSLALTTYVMRHTWATLMLESGKPVELISQCMGHSNIQTTQIYLSRISFSKVEAEVNDMLNLVRPKPLSYSKKKKDKDDIRHTHRWISVKNGVAQDEKVEIIANNALIDRLDSKNTSGGKDFPFLIKKEKISREPIDSTLISVAKISIVKFLSKICK